MRQKFSQSISRDKNGCVVFDIWIAPGSETEELSKDIWKLKCLQIHMGNISESRAEIYRLILLPV